MKLATCQMQPTGETWLGNIPAAWTFKRLKYCVQTLTDKVDKVPDDREYIGLESIESGTGRLLQRESPLIAEGGAALFECNDVCSANCVRIWRKQQRGWRVVCPPASQLAVLSHWNDHRPTVCQSRSANRHHSLVLFRLCICSFFAFRFVYVFRSFGLSAPDVATINECRWSGY